MLTEDFRPARGKVLNPAKVFDGLTYKQLAYCNNRAHGLIALEAYRSAYDCDGMVDATISGHAWKLEQDGRIVDKIHDLLAAKAPQTSLVPVVTKSFVLNGIVSIATKEDAKDNVRLRAFELLGKHVGLFKDEQPDDSAKPKSIVDIDAKLAEYFKLMTTIEGDATRVEPLINGKPVKSDGLPGVNPKSVKPEGAGYSPTQVDDSDRPRDRRRKPAS